MHSLLTTNINFFFAQNPFWSLNYLRIILLLLFVMGSAELSYVYIIYYILCYNGVVSLVILSPLDLVFFFFIIQHFNILVIYTPMYSTNIKEYLYLLCSQGFSPEEYCFTKYIKRHKQPCCSHKIYG